MRPYFWPCICLFWILFELKTILKDICNFTNSIFEGTLIVVK